MARNLGKMNSQSTEIFRMATRPSSLRMHGTETDPAMHMAKTYSVNASNYLWPRHLQMFYCYQSLAYIYIYESTDFGHDITGIYFVSTPCTTDYGVHSLPKLHSPTYYPIMRYQYYILHHAWSIRLPNVPLCNIHIVLCYMNVPFGYTPFVNLIFY